MMRRRAGFHSDQARCQSGKERDDLGTAQPPAQDDLALIIDAVDLEHVLGEIYADSGNLHSGRSLILWRS
jgi:hypothetical protein